MTNSSLAEECKASAPKRSGFRKVRTGCLTCKIRRIKCDEKKPSCARCISTGRVCDGYEAVMKPRISYAKPSSTTLLGPKLLLPRRDHDEIRSYRFFLDVASPYLASVFDYGFWLQDIPRICHADPAIWHAVVGLGAAYELYSRSTDDGPATHKLKHLVMAQANQSIRSLVTPSARHHDKSRALAASILFTCMSSIQGQHSEARLHLASSRKLLTELSYNVERTSRPEARYSPTISAVRREAIPSLPVCISTADAIIAHLEVQASAMDNGGLMHSSGILGASEAFNSWRYYQAPKWPVESESAEALHQLCSSHLVRANQASESLINALIYHWQQNVHLTQRLKMGNDPEALELLAVSERPFRNTLRELRKVFRHFEEAKPLRCDQMRESLSLALLALQLNLVVIPFLFHQDSAGLNPALEEQERQRQFAAVIQIAEDILRGSGAHGVASQPKPLVLGPLSMLAHGGSPQSLRRRAIALMREFPRRDGLGDSLLQASVFESIMEREQLLLQRDQGQSKTWGTGDVLTDEEVPSHLRSFSTTFHFLGERSALLTSRNWEEALQNKPGEACFIQW